MINDFFKKVDRLKMFACGGLINANVSLVMNEIVDLRLPLAKLQLLIGCDPDLYILIRDCEKIQTHTTAMTTLRVSAPRPVLAHSSHLIITPLWHDAVNVPMGEYLMILINDQRHLTIFPI